MKYGCIQIIKYENLNKHECECILGWIKCEHKGCGIYIRRDYLQVNFFYN